MQIVFRWALSLDDKRPPMTPDGVKTTKKDEAVSRQYLAQHLDLGLKTIDNIRNDQPKLHNLRFEW